MTIFTAIVQYELESLYSEEWENLNYNLKNNTPSAESRMSGSSSVEAMSLGKERQSQWCTST